MSSSHVWRRGIGAVMAGGMIAGLTLVLSPPALAGGGCHNPTVADASGNRVEMRDLCFTPTVLHVKLGQPVTWTNRDSVAHVVFGATGGWGVDEVPSGKSVTFRFSKAGVYPYFCYLHPAMVGALVVGDGNASGAAEGTIDQLAAKPIQAKPAAVRKAAAGPTGGELTAWRTAALALFGLLVVAGALLARRRSGSPPD